MCFPHFVSTEHRVKRHMALLKMYFMRSLSYWNMLRRHNHRLKIWKRDKICRSETQTENGKLKTENAWQCLQLLLGNHLCFIQIRSKREKILQKSLDLWPWLNVRLPQFSVCICIELWTHLQRVRVCVLWHLVCIQGFNEFV